MYVKTETTSGSTERFAAATEKEARDLAAEQRQRKDAVAVYACHGSGRIIVSHDRLDGRRVRTFS